MYDVTSQTNQSPVVPFCRLTYQRAWVVAWSGSVSVAPGRNRLDCVGCVNEHADLPPMRVRQEVLDGES